MFSRITTPLFVTAVIALAACTHDVVLPDAEEDDLCGDGIVESSEDCDTQSPGCTNCKTTPGWQCVHNTCFYPCGDGLSGTGSGTNCEATTKDAACDMTGWWISREHDSVRDAVLNQPQAQSTWFLYRFSQNGSAFQVEQALHCCFHGTGSAVVDCTPGTLRGSLYRNDPTPAGAHGPRKGSFAANGSACDFSFDRFYRVRGGTDALLPADLSQNPPLSTLPPLPYQDDPLCTQNCAGDLDNAFDTDGDGIPGASVLITGIATGIRESTEREYKEYATTADQTVAQNSIEFTVQGDWDLQESILSVNSCTSCSLIATPGHVDNATLAPRVTMRYLGSSLTSPRVAAVVVRNPGEDVDADLLTCANVRAALPHDPAP